MKHALASTCLLVLIGGAAVGCADGPDGDYPVVPNGFAPQSPGGTLIVVSTLTGRACVVADARLLAVCEPVGAGGLAVTLGGATAITAEDGTFQIASPAEASSAFLVTGANVVSSSQVFGGGAISIPVIPSSLFQALVASNGFTLDSGTGSIFATVVRSGVPLPGVTATSVPVTAFAPRFDGESPTVFSTTATGAHGIVLFPGIAVGTADLTFEEQQTSAQLLVPGVPVIDGGLTFVTVTMN